MPGFLPTLRSPVTKTLPMDRGERKVILGDYYSALASAGIDVANRARPWPIERAVAEGYERVVWVFNCVEWISGNSSRLPFRLRDGSAVVTDHPLYRVLNKRANPLETGQQFRKRLSAQILLSKRGAFVEVTKSRGGDVIRADLLPPGRTRVVPGTGNDLIKCYALYPRGGGKPRLIDVENVRWFREPHPIDPYSGITPLEAIGMSIELDYFARLFNVSFMRNDGRPGGVLAVAGEMDEDDMDRIESRFGKGPVEAGKMSVIAGELSYVDLAARPRDMQYGATSSNAKTEILAGFRLAESLFNAADRTFANAEQEHYNAWTGPMVVHNALVASGWDDDSEDDLEGYLDTTSVEVLQLPLRQAREEGRAEVAAGLRGIYSYAKMAGYADEIEDTPATRALWLPQGHTPIAARHEDEEAIKALAEAAKPPAPMIGMHPGALPPGGGAPGGDGGDTGGGGGPTPLPAGGGSPAALPPGAAQPLAATGTTGAAPTTTEGKSVPTARYRFRIVGREIKSLPAAPVGGARPRPKLRVVPLTKGADPGWRETDPGNADRDRLEQTIAATLSALVNRWVARTVSRVESPKSRKHTRHWTPEYATDTRVGNKALDASKVVDDQTWADDAEAANEPVATNGAVIAAAALYVALGDDDQPDEGFIGQIVADVVSGVLGLIGQSALRQAALMGDMINALDQAGARLDKITSAVREHASTMQEWAAGVAVQAATAIVEGARDAVVADLTARPGSDLDVDQSWRTRRDERVRDTHKAAEGQTVGYGEPFEVGGALLRYPGDPQAPYRETANCRCWRTFRHRHTGRFVPHPASTKIIGSAAEVKAGETFAATAQHAGSVTLHIGGRTYVWTPDDHPRDQHGKFISKGAEVRTAAGDIGKVAGIVDANHVAVQTGDGAEHVVNRHDVTVTKAADGSAPHDDVTKVATDVGAAPSGRGRDVVQHRTGWTGTVTEGTNRSPSLTVQRHDTGEQVAVSGAEVHRIGAQVGDVQAPPSAAPSIIGGHPVGSTITVQHDGHPHNGQTATITGAPEGADLVQTDLGPLSRHTRVLPGASAVDTPDTAPRTRTAATYGTLRPGDRTTDGWTVNAAFERGGRVTVSLGRPGSRQQSTVTHPADERVEVDRLPDTPGAAPLTWTKHGRGLVSGDGNYFIERGPEGPGTLYRRAEPGDARAERLPNGAPFDTGVALGADTQRELRQYADADNRVRAAAGTADTGATTGGVTDGSLRGDDRAVVDAGGDQAAAVDGGAARDGSGDGATGGRRRRPDAAGTAGGDVRRQGGAAVGAADTRRGDSAAGDAGTTDGSGPARPDERTPVVGAGEPGGPDDPRGAGGLSGRGAGVVGDDTAVPADAGLPHDTAVTEADQPVADPAALPTASGGRDFRPQSMDDLAPAGKVAKLTANMEALRTLRQLQAERRPATAAEQATLARWAGWGGLPEVFDPRKPQFAAQRAELEGTADTPGLLSPAEIREARRNTLNAHYTDARVVDNVWRAVGDLGFDGGRVLEPGSGSGTFIGFAPGNAAMVGVELDSTTAAISQFLYPNATIRNESFADTNVPDGSFDATVGNVPFGNFALTDRQHNAAGESIHNHFILKSLALTRPGGIVAVLTSRYTLDSQNDRARQEMANRADLIGAVRLPTGSHERASGTSVIEDILIFRVRPDGETPQADQSWVTAQKQEIDGQTITVNDYWANHAENVLGEIHAEKGRFGTGDMIVRGDRDMSNLPGVLDSIVADAKRNGLTATPTTREPLTDLIGPDGSRHEGHIQVEPDGTFSQNVGGASVSLNVPAKQAAELRGLIGLRDTLTSLLDAESRSGENTPEINALRAELNRRYDAYVGERRPDGTYTGFGPINRFTLAKNGARNRPGQGGFRSDPMSAVVRALEDFDAVSGTARKSAVFSQRAVAPRQVRTTADTPQDALALSMESYGEVNLPQIARLLGTDEATARAQLGNLVYEQPPLTEAEQQAAEAAQAAERVGDIDVADAIDLSTVGESVRAAGSLEPSSGYLSGNVRRKLAAARAAAQHDPRFQANVAALEAVLPDDLGPEEIDGRLGAAWIGPDTVADFLRDILNARYGRNAVQVAHSGGSIWTVEGPKTGNLATEQWGTPDRPAPELVQALLEQRPIKVTRTAYNPDGTTRSVPDLDATLAAQAKAEELQERFAEWLWEDADRARRLQARYNDQFNSIVLRQYTATAGRDFPGMNPDWKPHEHVKAAAERIVQEPTVLLAHVVGAGKTAEMTIGTQELRRLGLARKPAVVIPNHMLEQFSREYLEIYPQAKLLAAGTEDLQGDKRREFVARAATGDWDAVILTQSAFEAIPMSSEQVQAYIDREMAVMRRQLDEAQASDRQDKAHEKTVKKMEKALIRAEEALKKKLGKDKDTGVSFEQTGIDYLMVDEAHMYSNLRVLSNIQGAGNVGSDRATDLHMKMEYLRENSRTGRVATFATGTPIRNTVTQAYVMQRFLRPDLLEDAGIHTFDQWAATFGQVVEEMELKPEGTGFRQTSRFARFRNVPELLRLFHTTADVKMAEDLNLPTPNLTGGAVETVTVPASDTLRDYIRNLGDRAEAVRGGQVDPTEDNMLKISTDGRKAALSMKLVGEDHEPGKIEAAADRISSIYDANKDTVYTSGDDDTPDERPGALQIVFLDMGTPTAGSGEWNAYDTLKDQLVERGVPADQIAYIHDAKNDAQKAEMFAAARNGRLSVIIGSSEKMGVGTNIQKRAIALHHLDAPWRPADVEQRDGRIMRQGNQNPDVSIHRYVTEGSFDAYMWQTLERKAKFINQIMRGSLDVREIEDIGDTAMSYAEVKALATGNPDLLAKAKTDALLTKLERLERTHNRSQVNMRSDIARYEQAIPQWTADADALDRAIEQRVDTRGERFTATISGERFTKRTDAAERLVEALQGIASRDWGNGPERTLGTIGGHSIVAQSNYDYNTGGRLITVKFDGVPGEITKIKTSDLATIGAGIVSRLENGLESFEQKRDRLRTAIATGREEIDRMQGRQGGMFPRAAELAAVRAKSKRLAEKMQRDSRRAEGADVPFDPAIDTDRYDDPTLRDPSSTEVPPPDPDVTPSAADPGTPVGDEVTVDGAPAAGLAEPVADFPAPPVTGPAPDPAPAAAADTAPPAPAAERRMLRGLGLPDGQTATAYQALLAHRRGEDNPVGAALDDVIATMNGVPEAVAAHNTARRAVSDQWAQGTREEQAARNAASSTAYAARKEATDRADAALSALYETLHPFTGATSTPEQDAADTKIARWTTWKSVSTGERVKYQPGYVSSEQYERTQSDSPWWDVLAGDARMADGSSAIVLRRSDGSSGGALRLVRRSDLGSMKVLAVGDAERSAADTAPPTPATAPTDAESMHPRDLNVGDQIRAGVHTTPGLTGIIYASRPSEAGATDATVTAITGGQVHFTDAQGRAGQITADSQANTRVARVAAAPVPEPAAAPADTPSERINQAIDDMIQSARDQSGAPAPAASGDPIGDATTAIRDALPAGSAWRNAFNDVLKIAGRRHDGGDLAGALDLIDRARNSYIDKTDGSDPGREPVLDALGNLRDALTTPTGGSEFPEGSPDWHVEQNDPALRAALGSFQLQMETASTGAQRQAVDERWGAPGGLGDQTDDLIGRLEEAGNYTAADAVTEMRDSLDAQVGIVGNGTSLDAGRRKVRAEIGGLPDHDLRAWMDRINAGRADEEDRALLLAEYARRGLDEQGFDRVHDDDPAAMAARLAEIATSNADDTLARSGDYAAIRERLIALGVTIYPPQPGADQMALPGVKRHRFVGIERKAAGGGITVRVGDRSFVWKPDQHPRDKHGKFISAGGEVRTAAGDLAKVTSIVDANHVRVEHADGRSETVSRHDVTVTKAHDGSAPTGKVEHVAQDVGAATPDAGDRTVVQHADGWTGTLDGHAGNGRMAVTRHDTGQSAEVNAGDLRHIGHEPSDAYGNHAGATSAATREVGSRPPGDPGAINQGLDNLSNSHDRISVRQAANAARESYRNGDHHGAANALDATGDGQSQALAESIRQAAPSAPNTPAAPLSDEEYAVHSRHVEESIGAAIKAGKSTDAVHTLDPERKVWAPDRAALHKDIVDHLYAKGAHVPNDGRAVIAGGLGGAGKSTVLRGDAQIDQAAFLTLNPDDVKEEMARRGLVPPVEGLSPMEAAPLVHEESSHIANLVAQRAYAERKNVVWDITMSSRGSTERRIGEMRAAGYDDIEGVFVDIPVETSVARALARHRRGMEEHRGGDGLGGRYVSPSIIRQNASATTSSANRGVFDEVAGQFDRWSIYDNSGAAPVKVGNGLQGADPETVAKQVYSDGQSGERPGGQENTMNGTAIPTDLHERIGQLPDAPVINTFVSLDDATPRRLNAAEQRRAGVTQPWVAYTPDGTAVGTGARTKAEAQQQIEDMRTVQAAYRDFRAATPDITDNAEARTVFDAMRAGAAPGNGSGASSGGAGAAVGDAEGMIPLPPKGTPVSPRAAGDAETVLGAARVAEIVGPGGLSGATDAQLRRLIREANQQRGG